MLLKRNSIVNIAAKICFYFFLLEVFPKQNKQDKTQKTQHFVN